MEAAPPQRSLLGLPVDSLNCDQFVGSVLQAAKERAATTLVGYVNAFTVNLAATSPSYFERLAGFDCVVADGQAVVWASRYLGQPLPERVNVTDVMPDFIRRAADMGLRVALVGGAPGEADRFAARMREAEPGIQFVFSHHGYLDEELEDSVRRQITAADPDIVLLGMGSPLQEDRAWHWSREDSPRVWWCVGAVYEYFAGTRRRAPTWVRRMGMEWMVRLVQEPRRLWRRYVIGNPGFIWRVLRRRPLSGQRS